MRMRYVVFVVLMCVTFSTTACRLRSSKSEAEQARDFFEDATGLRLTGCEIVGTSSAGSSLGATVHRLQFVVPQDFTTAWLRPAQPSALATWNEELARRDASFRMPTWRDDDAARGEHFYLEHEGFQNYFSYDERTHTLYWVTRMIE